MTEYESENGAMIKCSNCGALIPPDDEFCSNCGTKVNASYKPEDPVSPAPAEADPAPASAGKWFSQAGSLDGSEVSGHAESGSVHSGPAVSSDSAPSAGTFIKPVKGIKENPTVIAGRKTEAARIPEADRKEASPSTAVPAKKGVYRCSKCGAVVPKGADLCWKCSSFESISDKPVVKNVERRAEPSVVSDDRAADFSAVHNEEPKIETAEPSRPFVSLNNFLKLLSIICFALVFTPSFLVSCSSQTYELGVKDVISGDCDQYIEAAGMTVTKGHPSLYLFYIIPVVVFGILFFKTMSEKLRAGIISGAIGVDLFVWYRYYSTAKTICSQYYCTFETTKWFTINIICLIIIFVIAILDLLNVLKLDASIIEKLKNPNVKNE